MNNFGKEHKPSQCNYAGIVARIFIIASLLLIASCNVLTNNKTIYTSELDLMSLTAKDTLSKKELNSINHYFRINPSKDGGRKIKFILHEKEDKEIRSDSKYKLKVIKVNDSIEVFLEFYGYILEEDQHLHSIGVLDTKNKHRYRFELILPKPNRRLKARELDSLYGYLKTVTIYHPFVDSVLYIAHEEIYSAYTHDIVYFSLIEDLQKIETKTDSAKRYKKITKRPYDGGNSFLKEYYYNYKETKGWTYKTKRTGFDTDMFVYWWCNYFLDSRDYERDTPKGFRTINDSISH